MSDLKKIVESEYSEQERNFLFKSEDPSTLHYEQKKVTGTYQAFQEWISVETQLLT